MVGKSESWFEFKSVIDNFFPNEVDLDLIWTFNLLDLDLKPDMDLDFTIFEGLELGLDDWVGCGFEVWQICPSLPEIDLAIQRCS